MGSVEGRVVFITGASSGVGEAVARTLHGEGALLALASRRGSDLGLDGALGIQLDVRDRDDVFRAVQATVDRFGKLDVVVANAGVGAYGPFLEMDPAAVEDMVDTNLKGTIYTAAATLAHLKESDAGDFVSLGSVAGVRAFPGEAVYNASKFGQHGFTHALDHELREHGVRASVVAPGGIKTHFALGTGRTEGDPSLEAMMTAQDVADVVLFTVTRPRHLRMLTQTFRPMSEATAG